MLRARLSHRASAVTLLIAALILLPACGRKPGSVDTPPGSSRLSYPPAESAR